jgi:hypothetical protein
MIYYTKAAKRPQRGGITLPLLDKVLLQISGYRNLEKKCTPPLNPLYA